jgi:hypothetical protein
MKPKGAVIQRFDVQEDFGLVIPVDLQKLLLLVVPSPSRRAGSPLVETMRRFDVDAKVVQSELCRSPSSKCGLEDGLSRRRQLVCKILKLYIRARSRHSPKF